MTLIELIVLIKLVALCIVGSSLVGSTLGLAGYGLGLLGAALVLDVLFHGIGAAYEWNELRHRARCATLPLP